MTTKREEYLANKKLHLQLYNEEIELRNRIWRETSKAELSAGVKEMEAYKAAQQKAREDVLERMKDDVVALKALQERLKTVEGYFTNIAYDCNHIENDGTSAIKAHYPYGSMEGSKGRATCTICSMAWD